MDDSSNECTCVEDNSSVFYESSQSFTPFISSCTTAQKKSSSKYHHEFDLVESIENKDLVTRPKQSPAARNIGRKHNYSYHSSATKKKFSCSDEYMMKVHQEKLKETFMDSGCTTKTSTYKYLMNSIKKGDGIVVKDYDVINEVSVLTSNHVENGKIETSSNQLDIISARDIEQDHECCKKNKIPIICIEEDGAGAEVILNPSFPLAAPHNMMNHSPMESDTSFNDKGVSLGNSYDEEESITASIDERSYRYHFLSFDCMDMTILSNLTNENGSTSPSIQNCNRAILNHGSSHSLDSFDFTEFTSSKAIKLKGCNQEYNPMMKPVDYIMLSQETDTFLLPPPLLSRIDKDSNGSIKTSKDVQNCDDCKYCTEEDNDTESKYESDIENRQNVQTEKNNFKLKKRSSVHKSLITAIGNNHNLKLISIGKKRFKSVPSTESQELRKRKDLKYVEKRSVSSTRIFSG